MTNEGLLSLCHALQKLESTDHRSRQGSQLPGLRVSVVAILSERKRLQFVDFCPERKPVQAEFDWLTDQLPLFDEAGLKTPAA